MARYSAATPSAPARARRVLITNINTRFRRVSTQPWRACGGDWSSAMLWCYAPRAFIVQPRGSLSMLMVQETQSSLHMKLGAEQRYDSLSVQGFAEQCSETVMQLRPCLRSRALHTRSTLAHPCAGLWKSNRWPSPPSLSSCISFPAGSIPQRHSVSARIVLHSGPYHSPRNISQHG